MNIKALLDKFAAITEEQQVKELASAVGTKDMANLEAFCQKHGIELAAEEKNAVAEFFKTGKMPLADQELENVAGGSCTNAGGFGIDILHCPECVKKHSDGNWRYVAKDGHDNQDFYTASDGSKVCKQCGYKWKPTIWDYWRESGAFDFFEIASQW
jgi:hypothetical protein